MDKGQKKPGKNYKSKLMAPFYLSAGHYFDSLCGVAVGLGRAKPGVTPQSHKPTWMTLAHSLSQTKRIKGGRERQLRYKMVINKYIKQLLD